METGAKPSPEPTMIKVSICIAKGPPIDIPGLGMFIDFSDEDAYRWVLEKLEYEIKRLGCNRLENIERFTEERDGEVFYGIRAVAIEEG